MFVKSPLTLMAALFAYNGAAEVFKSNPTYDYGVFTTSTGSSSLDPERQEQINRFIEQERKNFAAQVANYKNNGAQFNVCGRQVDQEEEQRINEFIEQIRARARQAINGGNGGLGGGGVLNGGGGSGSIGGGGSLGVGGSLGAGGSLGGGGSSGTGGGGFNYELVSNSNDNYFRE